MIEFRKNIIGLSRPYKEGVYHTLSWSLFQDGVEIQGVYVTEKDVHSYTNLTSIEISKARIDDFPKDTVIILEKLEELDFWSVKAEISKNALGLVGLKINTIRENEYLIKLVMKFDLNRWKEKYSFEDYRKEFSNILENRDVFYLEDGNDLQINDNWNRFDNEITSITFHNFTNNSIHENIAEYVIFLRNLHIETVQRIENNLNENIISLTFEFPHELKVPCEQYLLYFAQFLRDLGINAIPNLKEEAGKVLFSVTPTDNNEALDKIREALAVYLNLPSSPIVYDDSFAAMRLQQQIDSLKHAQQMAETEFRLKMAQILVEAQNKTIEDQSGIIIQQATFIQQQKDHIEKITNPAVMIDSVQNKEELEEIYDGLKIGESKFLKEQLGIHLNPAKVIKAAVKNTFGKDGEKKSVLGLDEEN